MSDTYQAGGHGGAVPRPGQQLPADPARIHADVEQLLRDTSGASLAERGQALERAHEVLVRALATVDKF